jgi:hypothetical protein
VIGTWLIDGLPYGEDGILVITPDFRVVQFPTSVTLPQMSQTHRLWGAIEGDDHLRFRPTPESEGWLRRVEITEMGWTMIAIHDGSEHRFNCRQVSAAFLPSWYPEQLDKNLRRMAETEAKQRADHALQ